MPFSRKLFTLFACVVATSLAAAEQSDDAKKKARADFLKQRDTKKPATAKAKESTKAKPADPKPTKETEKPKETAKTEEPKPVQKLSLPLPKGQDSKGVVIPYTDATGKKSMVFRIGVGRRLDDEQVTMSDLMIEMFDEKGVQEMTIELPASQLNLSTRTIAGNNSVTIKRSDFQLTGQTMEFNTETKQGWIKGNVKMIIYDLTEETGETAPKKGAKGS